MESFKMISVWRKSITSGTYLWLYPPYDQAISPTSKYVIFKNWLLLDLSHFSCYKMNSIFPYCYYYILLLYYYNLLLHHNVFFSILHDDFSHMWHEISLFLDCHNSITYYYYTILQHYYRFRRKVNYYTFRVFKKRN